MCLFSYYFWYTFHFCFCLHLAYSAGRLSWWGLLFDASPMWRRQMFLGAPSLPGSCCLPEIQLILFWVFLLNNLILNTLPIYRSIPFRLWHRVIQQTSLIFFALVWVPPFLLHLTLPVFFEKLLFSIILDIGTMCFFYITPSVVSLSTWYFACYFVCLSGCYLTCELCQSHR